MTFRDLAGEAAEVFTNVDGAVLRSFRGLVWPPGRLTRDYLAGRRARYLPPLRLYLLCSLAFVLGRGVRDWSVGDMRTQLLNVNTTIETDDGRRQVVTGDSAVKLLLDTSSVAGRQLDRGAWGRFVRGAIVDPQRFRTRVRETMPKALFVLVPAFALLLGLAFRRAGWAYPRHLVVALHVHAAGFLFFAAGQLVESLPGLTLWGDPLAASATLALTPVALRTIYGTGAVRGALTFGLLAVPYLALVGLATVAVLAIAALGT